ncbi:unnamed protein product, partial [Vitis vinifera]
MDSDASDFFRFAKVIEGCRFVAIRSCPEFESDSLSLLQKLYRKPVIPVGLLPAEANDGERDESWDLLKQWLDKKTENSVLYVALGTELTLSQDEMKDSNSLSLSFYTTPMSTGSSMTLLLTGCPQSGSRFRPPSLSGSTR